MFAVLGEESVAGGVRRIEALTGRAALLHIQKQRMQLREAAELYRVPHDHLLERLRLAIDQQKSTQQRIDQLEKGQHSAQAMQWLDQAAHVNEVRVVVQKLPRLHTKVLRSITDTITAKDPGSIVVLCSLDSEKGTLAIAVGKELLEKYSAADILQDCAGHLPVKGGGKAVFAQGSLQRVEVTTIIATLEEILVSYIQA